MVARSADTPGQRFAFCEPSFRFGRIKQERRGEAPRQKAVQARRGDLRRVRAGPGTRTRDGLRDPLRKGASDAVCARDVTEMTGTWLYRSLEAFEVDGDEPEMFAVARGPFKIIEQ